MEKLKIMWHSKSNVFRMLIVLLLWAGCLTPLQAVEPIKQYTLRFEGKKQNDNSAVPLRQITLSNLSQACDTTFTSTTFQLQVFPEATNIGTVESASSMQAGLSSENPFMSAAEVEVTLPSSAPLRLLLYGMDGKIQQRYEGEFEAGTHRFSVEPANSGVSFLTISDGQSRLTLKLIKLGAGNAANIYYLWSGESGQYNTRFFAEETVMLRAATSKPFIYCEGDQLQLIGYADGFANSSLYDIPTDDGEYTFLFDVPFYRIFGYEVAESLPSFVDVLFSVEDLNYKGVDNLSSKDFIIKENGNPITGTSESFAYIRKMNTIPYKIQTVLVLDNSYSLLPPDLAKMKAAAISMINNKENNQEIAVYCFSGEVALLQDFTTDTDLLVQAVNSIGEGTNSTNLYGAFITGVQKISERFTTEQITQGFMVVFTDGNDTRNPSSMIDEAIAARGNKRVYMVGLGDLDDATLNRLANPSPYFPVTSTDQLEQVFLSIQQDIVRYANSFYWLNFLSPKRDVGRVMLQIEIEQNQNTGVNSYLEGSFTSHGFVDSRGGVYIDPYLTNNGIWGYDETYTFTNADTDSHTLSAVTYYAENTPSYVWTSSDESVVKVKAIPQSFNKAELIFPTENNPGGVVTITVRDEANMDRSGNVYERTVQAQAFTVPKLTTHKVDEITYNTALAGGTITNDGGYPVTRKGVRYGTSQTELYEVNGSGDTDFTSNLTGLQPGTTYYVQAYAQNRKGKGYGNMLTFKTPDALAPIVTTSEVTNVTATSARCTSTVSNTGGSPITEQGVCWSTAKNPTIADSKATGTHVTLNGLLPNTTYHVRAYAINSAGTSYGTEETFKTEMILPAVTTKAATEVTSATATVGGVITDAGVPAYTEKGICYATTANPTVDNNKLPAAAGSADDFSLGLTGLSAATTYYVRAYAINEKDITYGTQVSFRTLYAIPSVTTGEVINITTVSAACSVTVTDNGGLSVSEQGVCWSTANNPTTADSKSKGTNPSLSGLSAYTTYYVRAYAVNNEGTGYGEVKKFTTEAIPVEVTTSKTVTEITEVSARVGGSIGNIGTPAYIEKGICYATTENPTTANRKEIAAGDGAGNFFVSLTGLTPGTTYYARAYAISATNHTVYGSEAVSFKTRSLPVVTTEAVSHIQDRSVVANGAISDAGDPTYTERGFVIATTENPTTADRKINVPAAATAAYSATITDLSLFTTYYIRAYATSSLGTVYGANVHFTTKQILVSTLAGSTPGYADGSGTSARFRSPYGVAVDASGNVYVADYENHCIRKITSQGEVTTLAGSTTSSYGSADGNGTSARFFAPSGVAVDASGNVYVADRGNYRIRKITPQGEVTTLAGSTYGSADGSGTSAKFYYPHDVAVDASGNVYVADYGNHLIRKITSQGEVTTLAGSTGGYADGSGKGAKFSSPSGVAVDASGNVYVADRGNQRIRKITSQGVVTTLAGSTGGYADGSGTSAKFYNPSGVAVDASGNVYVAEEWNHLIRKITSQGEVTTLAGSTRGYADGSGSSAMFYTPSGVAVDASGNVYVADRENHRIRKITYE